MAIRVLGKVAAATKTTGGDILLKRCLEQQKSFVSYAVLNTEVRSLNWLVNCVCSKNYLLFLYEINIFEGLKSISFLLCLVKKLRDKLWLNILCTVLLHVLHARYITHTYTGTQSVKHLFAPPPSTSTISDISHWLRRVPLVWCMEFAATQQNHYIEEADTTEQPVKLQLNNSSTETKQVKPSSSSIRPKPVSVHIWGCLIMMSSSRAYCLCTFWYPH